MLTHDPDFVPPFCPWPECASHGNPASFRHVSHGVYARQAPPRIIRRFRCLDCKRTFSTQTFDTTYFLKKPHLQAPLFDALTACSAFRQLGRSWRVAHSTLQRQASRLGRHCLLFERTRRPQRAPEEAVALDGFLSFEHSQFWPFELNVLVGTQSHYVYGMTESELRRSGRMTASQKRKREQLEALHGRPFGQATRVAVEQLILLAAPGGEPLRVVSDEHRQYPRAFRRLPHAIEHETCSSRRCRTARNPLFVVDLLDLLIRHGGSNHKRETIAFSKRRQGALERAAVVVVWRNHVKRISENDRRSPTPAQALGLADAALTTQDVLLRRLFPSLVPLPEPHRRWYWRLVPTRQVPGTRHELKWAA
jgi:transposase-like protein